MTIAEKLAQIGTNIDNVYNAGRQVGRTEIWELVERINLFEIENTQISYDDFTDDQFEDGLIWRHYYIHSYFDRSYSGTYKIVLNTIPGLNFPNDEANESFQYANALTVYWVPKLSDESNYVYCQIYTDIVDTLTKKHCEIIASIETRSDQPECQPNINGYFILKPKADGSYDVPTEWWIEIYKLAEA